MSRIDYQTLLDNALKSVVKDALIHAQFNGLGDGAHFYITFKTRTPGVVLPDFLRIRYPDIMTIVLQYSYNNLHVSDKEFGVQLTFDGRPFFIRVLGFQQWRRGAVETQYIYRLGEFTGSCLLELRVGTDTEVPKFSRADSLYILDDAFYQVLEPLFRLVVQDFDMFENTVIDKFQWKKIRELDIEAYVKADFVQETAGMLAEIDQWVTAHIPDGSAFLVIGV